MASTDKLLWGLSHESNFVLQYFHVVTGDVTVAFLLYAQVG